MNFLNQYFFQLFEHILKMQLLSCTYLKDYFYSDFIMLVLFNSMH